MVMHTTGKVISDFAREIYKHQRTIVNWLIKSGEIAAKNADKEWAKRVAKELIKEGYKVPKKILEMMK